MGYWTEAPHVSDRQDDALGVGLSITGSETALRPLGEVPWFSHAFSCRLSIVRLKDAGLSKVVLELSRSNHHYHHLHQLNSQEEDVSSKS